MLDARSHIPYLRWTPRRITLDDGREVDVPEAMTLSDFEHFPWPAGQRWELLWGNPVMTPSPAPQHQSLLTRLLVALDAGLNPAEFHILPGVDVRLPGTDNYVCPDISVLSAAEVQDIDRLPVTALPRLVVELLSPSTRGNDLGAKLDAYAAAGVPEYWVANPRTGALSVYFNPVNGYDEQAPDKDGFTFSLLLNRGLKILRLGTSFKVETRKA